MEWYDHYYRVVIPKMKQNFGTDTDPDRALRALISDAIRRSPLKRAAIAEALTAKIGVRVSLAMLNDYTSDSKRGVRFPLLFSAALCEILEDDSIGLFAVRPHVRKLVEFAERELAGFRDQRERENMRESLLNESSPKHGRA
jgi:hypothetical protein